MPRIKVVDYASANGRLKEIYDELISKRGNLADVHTIQSLRPESIVKHMDLYLEIMFSHSELSRAQREMIAVVVSVANGCSYCQAHHAAALNHYWKNLERVGNLKIDYTTAGLTEKEMALCRYAVHLTNFPGEHETIDQTALLKEQGLSDHAILDATLVVAYFNFVNRIVLSLGLKPAINESRDYKY
jgi:uncharacterized peroxidase-related enzyme